MKSVLDSQFRKNKSVMQEHLAHKHLKSSLKKISEPMLLRLEEQTSTKWLPPVANQMMKTMIPQERLRT